MRMRASWWAAGALTSVALLGFACAESQDSALTEGGNGTGGSLAGTGGGGLAGSTAGVGGNFTTGVGGGNEGGSCVDLKFEAEQVVKPADIIIVIDNSGSMSQEIAAVESNINVNFANILAASQVDYQVIMITNHGTGYVSPDYLVCIGPPLSNATNCNGPPGDVPNQFHHYDVSVDSWNAPCKVLKTLYGPNGGGEADQWNLHPEGYSKWLRAEAVKMFLVITDDRMGNTQTYCNFNGQQINDGNDTSGLTSGQAAQTALLFDQLLLGMAPGQFGTTAARNYIWHSIIGVAAKPVPTEPYQPSEPPMFTKCQAAVNTGPGYQWLSKGTGGLRFPICEFASFDAVFQEIAAGVVEGASVPCEFEIPEPDGGEPINLKTLVVEYTPGGNGTPETFESVSSAAACGLNDSAFYIEGDKLVLCPKACDKVKADGNADVAIVAQCEGKIE